MTFALRPYQDTAVESLRDAYRSGKRAPLFQLATGGGKCLGRGTPVLMFDGAIKAVETVMVGDRLMGPDSRPRTVLSVCQGRDRLYRVIPVKGDSFVVNEAHILSLKLTPRRNGGTHVVVNIGILDYQAATHTFRHRAKAWRAAVDWPPSNEPARVDPYFLGLWLGDGNTGKPTICSGDPEVAAFLSSYAESLDMALRVDDNSQNSRLYTLVERDGARGPGMNRMTNALRHYGLIGNKHIPHRFKTGSRAERLEVLAGIMDTDGYWTGKGFDLTLKSERLIDDVIFVARSLGFAAYKRKTRKTCVNTGAAGDYWRCSINGPVDLIPCRIARKQAPARMQKKDPLVTGVSVEPIGDGEYFGFEIDGDHLFLLGDFTVTHNTFVFCHIGLSASARGKNVLILVHRQELLLQSSRSLSSLGVDHGLVAPGHSPTADRVQVASVQTVVRRLANPRYLRMLQAVDLLVIDEAHHAVAGSWCKVIEALPQAKILGVTATPCRLDNKGLGNVFDTLVQGPSIGDLIDLGYLVPPVVYAPPEAIDLTGVRSSGGDYVRSQLATAVDKPKITGSAVDHYRRICPGVPAIAFCASIAHAEHVAAEFNSVGIRASSIDGTMPDGHRANLIRALGDGRLKVLTSCDIISEGTDIPVVGAAILLRPTKSTSLFLQQVGRALRPAPGKDKAVILDHVGNVLRHGMPDEERTWSLEKGFERTSRSDGVAGPQVRQCPSCYAAHSPAPVCPACGHRYAPARQVAEVGGELKEVDAKAVAAARKAARLHDMRRAKTREELEAVAKKYGYRRGWVDNVLRFREEKRQSFERRAAE